ncbi:hypothetical protein L4D77_25840 [Photobacterium frigidiphilum]|uniref:hypothetical protein n=1 Tax=Photobacterium frigidiphilum TaxID=264736 RepID=UPI003D0AFF12
MRLHILLFVLVINSFPSYAADLTLSYSDARVDVHGLSEVNKVLTLIGVRVGYLEIKPESLPIIKASKTRIITSYESDQLLSIYSLSRKELVNEIVQSGRKPHVKGGGNLHVQEVGAQPYPKVYDLKSVNEKIRVFANHKYGKLHVNTSDDSVGLDELGLIMSGGPWIWFFSLPDNSVVKLTLGNIELGDDGWIISYSSMVPHGGFMVADHGVSIAYAIGPKDFVMRYEAPKSEGSELLGTNPWIDFIQNTPKLLKP